ncbi:unnamed protein product [Adineta steineri]|uniref:Uncharacterized protein n=2 Tax=Adineta steineri TaxID=433720 RepID=A0A819T0P9_9BILA|nr:unnamed protein product [Adineta steineri]
MPADGLCADLTCDKETKHLYECHCCSSLICFHHLSEHIEAAQRNKERFNSLQNELKTVVDKFKVIIEKKLLNIEREKSLIEKAQQFLDAKNDSIDEVQIIFEEIEKAIGLSQLQGIIKLEPTLPNTKNCSCISKIFLDELLSKTTSSPSKSLVHLNLTDKTNTSIITTDNKYSMCDTSGIVDCNSLVRTTATIEDEDIDKEQNKCESKSIYRLRGLCPLTFNGAFGLTAANHSMHFCLNKKTDLIGLYDHFLSKHQLQSICIRRLLRAISNNEDPKTTKLFNENEDVINHLYKMPCPFSKKMTHLIRCPKKNIKRVPCTYILSRNTSLNWHLQYYHGASSSLARELVVQSKKIQMKNINSSHD